MLNCSLNPKSASYNLQQRTISNLAAFSKITNKAWYLMRIVCQQTILMKYHTLFLSPNALYVHTLLGCFVIFCTRLAVRGKWKLKVQVLFSSLWIIIILFFSSSLMSTWQSQIHYLQIATSLSLILHFQTHYSSLSKTQSFLIKL